MQNNWLEFTIEMAGGLIWLAPSSVGGLSMAQLGQVWDGSADEKVPDLVARGVIMPMSLYQDDGYNIRFIIGNLNEQEEAEWTARVCWKLNVPCGKIIVNGTLPYNFEVDEFPESMRAVNGGSYCDCCYVDVPPGEYQVEVYSYPPHDLSMCWEYITNVKSYGEIAGIEPEEAEDYFRRTRPNEQPPDWMTEHGDISNYIDFIIRLQPIDKELSLPTLESGDCIAWEFRKPAVCPIGILGNSLNQS